jgi:trehalose 6-phosphate phosphatase
MVEAESHPRKGSRRVLARLVSAYRSGKTLLLLFDYDGTLADFSDDPSAAGLSRSMRRALASLTAAPRVAVGILSGRRLRDLETILSGARGQSGGLSLSFLAGTSGLELKLRRKRVVAPGARHAHRLVDRLSAAVEAAIAEIPGAWLERKALGVSIHWRKMARRRTPLLASRIAIALRPFRPHVTLVPGRFALEVNPALGWDKGTALSTIVRHAVREGFELLYAGDSANDAAAFAAAQRLGGIAIGVGPAAPRGADCRFRGPPALGVFLSQLAAALRQGHE